MRLNEKRKSELYNAISEPIMDVRITIQKYGSPSSEDIDSRLFRMQSEIWKRVHNALNLAGPR